jgi:arsenate reductase
MHSIMRPPWRQAKEHKPVKATIWHNPKCGTSRNTLALLEETPGVELTVVEYLKTPYTRDRIAGLITDAGLTPQAALRLRGTDAEEQGLPDASDDAVLDAMAANPAYVERPFVETEKGVRLCRPMDKVREIL